MPLYENFGPDSIGTSPLSSGARFQPSTRNSIRVYVGFSAARLSLAFAKSKPKPDSINHSDLSVIFVQPQNVSTLLGLSPKLPTLKSIVSFGEIPEAARKIADAWGKEREIRIFTLDDSKLVFGFLHFPRFSDQFRYSRGDRSKDTFTTSNCNSGYDCDYLLHLCTHLYYQSRMDVLRMCSRVQQAIQKVSC